VKSHVALALLLSSWLGASVAQDEPVPTVQPGPAMVCHYCRSPRVARLEYLRKDPRQDQQFQEGHVAYLIPAHVLPCLVERKALREHRAYREPASGPRPISGDSYFCFDCEKVGGTFSEAP
jgi:hypothetical protein